MKKDMNDLKKLVFDMLREDKADAQGVTETHSSVIRRLYDDVESSEPLSPKPVENVHSPLAGNEIQDTEEIVEESLSLVDKEIELIRKALDKYSGKRKMAAEELGISERTLYRKIKEYGIDQK